MCPDFVLLTGSKSRGGKRVAFMHQNFYNSCYSLHSCFAISALGDDFTKKKQKKEVILISLY